MSQRKDEQVVVRITADLKRRLVAIFPDRGQRSAAIRRAVESLVQRRVRKAS